MPLYTVQEFAQAYGFTQAEIKRHIADGMPAESINGGPRVIPEDEAIDWLEERGLIEPDESGDELEDEEE